MADPRITLSPKPPKQGGQLTITYTGTPGTELLLDWDPAGEPTSVVIGDDGTATVTVPAKAQSLIVDDPTPGGADSVSTSITPS